MALKNFRFLIVDGAKVPIGRRSMARRSDDLEEVVLDHVAQTAGGFVKRATVPTPKSSDRVTWTLAT